MVLMGIEEAVSFLKSNDNYIIYTHASPDGDTLGSACALALALRAIGKKAIAFCADGIPRKLSFLPTEGIFTGTEPEALSGYTPISVDVAGERVLGSAKNRKFAFSVDHHRTNTLDCEGLLVMPDKIACGEIIFMLCEMLGVPLTEQIAVSLYTAICSDSGGFRYSAVTAETHKAAAKCLEAGIDHFEINRRLFECKTHSQIALIKAAYEGLELLCGGKYAIVALTPEKTKECGACDGDFECINAIPREIDGVYASAVLRQKGENVKVSLRSGADIDVSLIASRFGGGGHYHAAGFTLEKPFGEALALVRSIFSEMDL